MKSLLIQILDGSEIRDNKPKSVGLTMILLNSSTKSIISGCNLYLKINFDINLDEHLKIQIDFFKYF